MYKLISVNNQLNKCAGMLVSSMLMEGLEPFYHIHM